MLKQLHIVISTIYIVDTRKSDKDIQQAVFPSYSQKLRLKLDGALQDHSLIVLTQLFRYPGTGLSYGMA